MLIAVEPVTLKGKVSKEVFSALPPGEACDDGPAGKNLNALYLTEDKGGRRSILNFPDCDPISAATKHSELIGQDVEIDGTRPAGLWTVTVNSVRVLASG